jgi:hypothetical protein
VLENLCKVELIILLGKVTMGREVKKQFEHNKLFVDAMRATVENMSIEETGRLREMNDDGRSKFVRNVKDIRILAKRPVGRFFKGLDLVCNVVKGAYDPNVESALSTDEEPPYGI